VFLCEKGELEPNGLTAHYAYCLGILPSDQHLSSVMEGMDVDMLMCGGNVSHEVDLPKDDERMRPMRQAQSD
jgi:hypothetical protein